MTSEPKTVAQLMYESEKEMRRLRYSDKSIQTSKKIWGEFEEFSLQNESLYFSQELAIKYLREKYNYPDPTVTRHATKVNAVASSIRRLGDISEHGRFLGRFKKQELPIQAEFQAAYQSYVDYCVKRNNKLSTIKRNELIIKNFFEFLTKNDVKNTTEINPKIISDYAASLLGYSKKSVQRELGCLKGFFKAIYFNGIHKQDLSVSVPKLKFAKEEKIATIWSQDDVLKIFAAIDKGNPYGKRDYAILLLISNLGLRDSDVRNLKLENLNWEKNLIEITQVKTGQALTLPLLPEIGWAIINYLKAGRPTSDVPFVFIKHQAPYGQLTNIRNILARYQRESGVKIDKNKQHGVHTLRHTLASRLLEQHVPLELISGILGHVDVNSAKVYLHTDIDGLRKCALNLSEDHLNE
ncbi:MAG: tyrosine-type recombinase/integrase [Bacillaceae bacterium]|nr:tyrosine-type recombinase/integrase [Bacillaceae bacterium]